MKKSPASGRKPVSPKGRKGGGKSAASTISVRKSTVVKRTKKDALVEEKYNPTGKGRAKTGYTHTKGSPKARSASQRGSSNQALDKKVTARAPGKRAQVGRTGKATVYYEYRENRSDADTRRRL